MNDFIHRGAGRMSTGYTKRDFGGKKFQGGNRYDRTPMPGHKAVCGECGANCEVPFRPTGDRPVYCSHCFAKKQGDDPRGQKKVFNKGSFYKPGYEERPRNNHSESGDIKSELQTIHRKLDQIARSIDRLG